MSKPKFSLIAIYGGTFDPIHYGHLRIAEELVDIVGLSKINFVPSGTPRLRNAPIASKYHRLAMVRMAINNNNFFALDEREVNRSGESSSVESLREYRQEFSENTAFCFILGTDAFIKLPQWRCWRELFQLCHMVIVDRPGHASISNHDRLPQCLKDECSSRWVFNAYELKQQRNGLVFFAPTSLLEISATKIRTLIATGKSIRYLLPEVVFDYIKANHLYSEGNESK